MNDLSKSTPSAEEKPKWWLKSRQRRFITYTSLSGFFVCTWMMTTIALIGLFARLCYEVWPTKAFMETCFAAGVVWSLCLVVLHATAIGLLGTILYVMFDYMWEKTCEKLGISDEDSKL